MYELLTKRKEEVSERMKQYWSDRKAHIINPNEESNLGALVKYASVLPSRELLMSL